MPRFLLLVSPERPAPEALSPSGMGRRAQAFIAWIDTLRHERRLSGGGLLGDASERLSRGMRGLIPEALDTIDTIQPIQPIHSRGAAIRMFFLVEAADMRSAVEIAGDCPSALPGTIDVFQLEAQIETETGLPRSGSEAIPA